MNSDNFGRHNCEKLNEIFMKKPYQGQSPGKSKVLFVGQDANYPQNIDEQLCRYIMEYHEDGVSFWKKYQIHHPFLLPEFKKQVGGINYHRKFASLGLEPDIYADHISFVELTDIPTCGNTGKGGLEKFLTLISYSHIARLENWILNSGKKLVFVPRMVMSVYLPKICRKTGSMKWLIDCDKRECGDDAPIGLYEESGVFIYKYNHFSGAVSNVHLAKMATIIKAFISDLA